MGYNTQKKRSVKARHNKFVSAFLETNQAKSAAIKAGYAPSTASKRANKLLALPEIQQKIEEGLSDAAIAAGVSRAWILSKLKEVAERCLQAQPVFTRGGKKTGLFVFDAAGANRSLELLGKHIKLFGDDASPAAQLGAAVIRVLAQEAQLGRRKTPDTPTVEAKIIETTASPTTPDTPTTTPTETTTQAEQTTTPTSGTGPIGEPSEEVPLASMPASCPAPNSNTVNTPPDVEI